MKPQRSPDYYEILGADENASERDIERHYKQMASRHHPDKGGSEEAMKSLNEAYGVLKDQVRRREYDAELQQLRATRAFTVVSAPSARDIGAFGHFLSAFLCLLLGLFLLFLVRMQWIWFLWPLSILSVLVIFFGVWMAHSATSAYNQSLSLRNPLRHVVIRESLFWTLVLSGGYAVYILLTSV